MSESDTDRQADRQMVFIALVVVTGIGGFLGIRAAVLTLGSDPATVVSSICVLAAILLTPTWGERSLLVTTARVMVLWFAFMTNAIVLVSVPLYLGFAGLVVALVVVHRLLRPRVAEGAPDE